MHKPWRLIPAFLGAIASLLLPRSSHAETHALVVGIDDYAFEQKLSGAVADAADIASALARAGVIFRSRKGSRAGGSGVDRNCVPETRQA